MASKEQYPGLKLLVISMGFVLVGGFIVVTALAISKYSAARKAAGSPTATASTGCKDHTATLLHGNVVSVSEDAAGIHVVSKDGKNYIATRFDACSGQIISSFTLVPGK